MDYKHIFIILGLAGLVSCSGSLGGRIDQHADVPVPSPVTVKSVYPTSGGAVIKVTIPDDPNLKGVVAEYERGGRLVNTKISRYIDSLTVEGYADTQEHIAKIYSFNVNEERSEPIEVRFTPLKPAILIVKPTLIESFGGVKVHIQQNYSKADLAICILRCDDPADYNKPVKDVKWTEVTTLFTASEDIFLSRRGIEPKEAIFGVYLRDHWGNLSDTTTAVLTPIVESKLDTVRYNGTRWYQFKSANIADDNCQALDGSHPIQALWDNSGASITPHYFASVHDAPSPCWLTIDLGHKACLSRITTLPRIGYLPFSGGAVRDYEFWGSLAPTGKPAAVTLENPYGFDDTWFCLGKFTQPKPSGYLPNGLVGGEPTAEDKEAFNAGNDFELDPVQYPRCNDQLRYLRVVFVHTFTTFEYGHKTSTRQIQTGEVTPFGQPIYED